ncbi:MAG: hypothetical protein ABIU06_14070 [Anaerolineales bacterium]
MITKKFIDQFDQLVMRIYRFQDSHESISNIKDEIYGFLDQNYETYLNSNSQVRKEIRDLVKKHHTSGESPNFLDLFLIGYVQRAAEKIKTTGDKVWLARGLAVATIEDSLLDQRDSTFSLSYLYVMAEEKDLNPRPEFQAIAEISSDEVSSGGIISMSELMKNIPNIARKQYDNCKEFT